jgi:hypothetical protein
MVLDRHTHNKFTGITILFFYFSIPFSTSSSTCFELHSNEIVDYRLLFLSGVRHGRVQSIVADSVVLCGTSLSVDACTAAAYVANTEAFVCVLGELLIEFKCSLLSLLIGNNYPS